jgi:LPS-assembly protein
LALQHTPKPSALSLAVALALPLLAAQSLTATNASAQVEALVDEEQTAATEPQYSATSAPQTPETTVQGMDPSNTDSSNESIESLTVTAQLDWQPLPLVPAAQQDLRCRQCDGAFIDPLVGQIPTEPGSTDVQVSADVSDSDNNRMNFSGDVSVVQGNRSLRADEVQFDRTQQITTAEGNIGYREPGVALLGDSFQYDSSSKEAKVTDARFVLHAAHMSGTAVTLERQSTGHIAIDEGAMTFCAPEDPTWFLKGDDITIDPAEGMAEVKHATLEVGGIPVFYLPWITFPINDQRKTGLLSPSIGSDTRGGLDYTQPIYFNLAPNYDATYAPRFIGERGLLHQGQGRWLNPLIGMWEVNGQFIGTDDKYRDEINPEDDTRWLVGVQQRGQFGPSWRTTIDYSKVSDPDYVRDLDNSTLSSQRQTALMQLGQLDYLGSDWLVSIQAQQFQSLADDIRNNYKKLPQVTAQYRGSAGWRGFQPVGLLQYSNFDSDAVRVTGERVYAEAGVTYPMSWTWGFLRPTVKYRALQYKLDEIRNLPEAEPDAGSGVFSLDGGLIFERSASLAGASMTQTLEPRLFYLYSQHEEQTGQPDFDTAELTFSYNQLFRDTRFSGHDRLDDANQLAIGVTTRFFADSDGRERLNASIGQLFYFRDREVRLGRRDPALTESTSATAVEFNWLPNEVWTFRSSILYDTNENRFDAASIQLNHRPGDGRVFNIGYTLREPPPSLLNRPVTEQANVSAYYPINDNWRIFGALEYSLEANEAVEDMLGLEYDGCCWQARLLYMRYIDTAGGFAPDFSDPNLERENAVQFQFSLKGMGGFGRRVENLLTDMIRGFNDRYY